MAAISGTTAAVISAVSIAASLAGTGLRMHAQAQQDRAQQAQADYQARVARKNQELAEEQAREARRQGHDAAVRKRQEVAGIIGSQRAGAGASGATVDAGSFLDLTMDTAEKGEMDALALHQQGWTGRTILQSGAGTPAGRHRPTPGRLTAWTLRRASWARPSAAWRRPEPTSAADCGAAKETAPGFPSGAAPDPRHHGGGMNTHTVDFLLGPATVGLHMYSFCVAKTSGSDLSILLCTYNIRTKGQPHEIRLGTSKKPLSTSTNTV